MFTFGQILLGKVWTPLSSQLWVKQYHYCSSRRMALALNNLKRVDMPLNKETKSNQICCAIAFTLCQITLGKIWTSLNSQLCVEKYYYCSSRRNKETKPNRTLFLLGPCANLVLMQWRKRLQCHNNTQTWYELCLPLGHHGEICEALSFSHVGY